MSDPYIKLCIPADQNSPETIVVSVMVDGTEVSATAIGPVGDQGSLVLFDGRMARSASTDGANAYIPAIRYAATLARSLSGRTGGS